MDDAGGASGVPRRRNPTREIVAIPFPAIMIFSFLVEEAGGRPPQYRAALTSMSVREQFLSTA